MTKKEKLEKMLEVKAQAVENLESLLSEAKKKVAKLESELSKANYNCRKATEKLEVMTKKEKEIFNPSSENYYSFVKYLCKEIEKTFPNVVSLPHGYCCNTDYFSKSKYSKNAPENYFCAKLFKGGLNSNYTNGEWDIIYNLYFTWRFENDTIKNKVFSFVEEFLAKFNVLFVIPKNDLECFEIVL